MTTPADIPDCEDQMLARLAQLDLAAAERVHGQLMAAEAAHEVAELGRTYQRFARSLRQTLALRAKFRRDREAERKAEPPAPHAKPSGVAVARRARDLKDALVRIAWDEAEDAEAAEWSEQEIKAQLAKDCLREDFCDEPLADHVARLCLVLEFSPDAALAWLEHPEPPPDHPAAGAGRPGEDPGPDDAGRRSSA